MRSRLDPGSYWVRPFPAAEWEPAVFDGDDLWLTGSDTPVPLDTIGEVGAKLEPPQDAR